MGDKVILENSEGVSDVEIEEWEPTLLYAAELDGAEWEPTPDYAVELEKVDATELVADPFYWAQEKAGERKILLVDADEGRDIIELDCEVAKIGGDLKVALLEAGRFFGPYEAAVDVYRENNAICLAISQMLHWKGQNVSRHITNVRLIYTHELYGFLVNHGGKDRVKLLDTAKTKEDKEALEDAVFFHSNRGYNYP